MTFSDFQVLLAPVIGTVAAIGGVLLGVVFTLRRERELAETRAARKAKIDSDLTQEATSPVRKDRQPEPVASH